MARKPSPRLDLNGDHPNVRHGDKRRSGQAPEYRIWTLMKDRCLNPSSGSFARYGGRGITICERWRESYAAFLADMGRRPGPGFSIDRIDNAGPYAPENCQWATMIQQARNTRRNKMLTLNGVTRCLAEWAELLSMDPTVLNHRLRLGWSVERALTTPLRPPRYAIRRGKP
jgi:hypothetical protein